MIIAGLCEFYQMNIDVVIITGAMLWHHDRSTVHHCSVARRSQACVCAVREYYDKDGTLAPGSKGLALDTTQWGNLVATLGTLTAAAHAA